MFILKQLLRIRIVDRLAASCARNTHEKTSLLMRSTYLLSLLSSAAIYIALSVAAFAAPPSPTPLAKFTAAGLRPNEYVGYSVATDGQRVLIGTDAGSAFIYDPFSQLQLAKVILPDPRFGTSVALQGNIAVVGTRGGAYLYDFSNMASVSRITLTPDDYPASVVGGSVDLSGDVVIAGAASDSTFGETSGAAYLFNSVTGVQIAKLVANDAQPNDGFGIAVAIDNGLAAVANSQPTSPTGGAVYLFDAEASAVGNRQLAKYTAANGQQSPGQFGYNVDINEETLVATQPFGRSFFWPADGTPTPLPNSSFNTRAAADGISVSDDYIALGFEEQGLVRLYK